jgi:hypothetical protein
VTEALSARSSTHDRWVVNKLRALGAYYTKGIENGADFRSGLNTTASLDALRDLIHVFFFESRSRPI